MYSWIVTIAQIAAILVCPLSCGSGQCHGRSCCAAAQTIAVQPAAKSCCCCDKRDSHEKKSIPSLPGKPVCQGVCGGAIFEKPCELPAEMNLCFLPPAVLPLAVVVGAEFQPADHHEVTLPGGNYGRSLRILHESYLC